MGKEYFYAVIETTMNYQELIQPQFGRVRILEYALGDDFKDGLLLRYYKQPHCKDDICSINIVEDDLNILVIMAFDNGKLYTADLLVASVFFKPLCDYLHSLIAYMTDQGYYETYISDDDSCYTFSNYLNELTISFMEDSVHLNLERPDSESPHEDPAFEEGAVKTIKLRETTAKDGWGQLYKETLATRAQEAVQNEEMAHSWRYYIRRYKNEKPRLYACLQKAEVAAEKNGGMSIKIPVAEKVQAEWFEKNILPEMKRELSVLINGKEVEITIQCAQE